MPGLPKWIPAWQNIDQGDKTLLGYSFSRRGKVALIILVIVTIQQACSLPGSVMVQPTKESNTDSHLSATVPTSPNVIVPILTQTPVFTQTPVITDTPQQQMLKIQSVNSEASMDVPKYNLILSKPVLFGEEESVKDFNRQVDALFQEQIDIFKKLAQENETWRAQNMPEFFSRLDLRCDLAYLSDELVSLSMPVESYIAGMAHPDHFTRVINYDLLNSRVLGLGDVFQSQDQILPILASYCKDELITRGELMFEEGVLPELANYQNWVITEQGFVVIFDPYHIAPYAMGTITVTIPWAVLAGEINPQGPLVRFLAQ